MRILIAIVLVAGLSANFTPAANPSEYISNLSRMEPPYSCDVRQMGMNPAQPFSPLPALPSIALYSEDDLSAPFPAYPFEADALQELILRDESTKFRLNVEESVGSNTIMNRRQSAATELMDASPDRHRFDLDEEMFDDSEVTSRYCPIFQSGEDESSLDVIRQRSDHSRSTQGTSPSTITGRILSNRYLMETNGFGSSNELLLAQSPDVMLLRRMPSDASICGDSKDNDISNFNLHADIEAPADLYDLGKTVFEYLMETGDEDLATVGLSPFGVRHTSANGFPSLLSDAGDMSFADNEKFENQDLQMDSSQFPYGLVI